MRQLILSILTAWLLLAISCDPFLPEFPEGSVEGMRPVYGDSADFAIEKLNARGIQRAGKIYYYQDLLMINEAEEGIHVVDNSDKSNPVTLFFISIPGNTDVAIRDGLLYANNYADLVTFKITNGDLEVIDRIENLFLEEEQMKYPLGEDVYFDCVDESQGRIIRWEPAILTSPECYKR